MPAKRLLLAPLGAVLLLLPPAGCHQVHEAKARQLTRSAAEAYFEEDFDKALEHSEIALRLGAREPELHRIRSSIYYFRGDLEAALRESDAALALLPGTPGADADGSGAAGEPDPAIRSRYLTDRSNLLLAQGRQREGREALEQAVALNPEDPGAQNNLAWFLATSPEAALRDGRAAVRHARQACELTEWKEAGAIDTLAAACAEAGDFDEAVARQREAIATFPRDEEPAGEAEGFEARLRAYEARQPYREDPVAEYRRRLASESK